MRRILLSLAIFSASVASLSAQGSDKAKPAVKLPVAASKAKPMPAPSAGDYKNVEWLLRSLADDSMQGRGTATPGGERAARLIASQMKKIGLSAPGDIGFEGFTQLVPMRALAAQPGFQPRMITLPRLADLDTIPADQRRMAKNVIGIIPGSDPVLKHEIILVLAHYDHLGLRVARPARGTAPGAAATPPTAAPTVTDTIFNGADDDASGTVAVLEIARHLNQGPKPKRTIVFAAMTGEETGMIGTNFYLKNPLFPLSQVVAGFEIEMIGRPDSLAGGVGKAWLTGYDRSTMGDMLKEYGIPIVPDARPSQNFFQRSDNYALARMGIVAHTLSTFNLHTDYHQVTDEADRMDFHHMTLVISAAAEAVRHLANGPTPAWHEGGDPSKAAAATGRGRGRGGE